MNSIEQSNNHSGPLSELTPGSIATIVELGGGRGIVGRLAALGFTPGSDVQVVRNDGRGPLIIAVLDTQIALGRGQASKVLVKRKPVE